MRRFSLLLLGGCLLAACRSAAGVPDAASNLLLLHPVFDWSAPHATVRTISFPDGDVNVEGREIVATYDDQEIVQFSYPESEFPDQDFWRYYLGEGAVQQLGYSQFIAEEAEFDRQFLALSDGRGYVLMLSNIVEFSVPLAEDPQCPCTYTFTIFTNDRRILLE